MRAPHEVWARPAWAAIDLAKEGGLDTAQVFANLPFDDRSVRSLKRMSWDDYCTLCENICALAGGEFEDLLESSYHQVMPELRSLVGGVVDSKRLLWFVATILCPIMFPPLHLELQDLGGRRMRLTITLREGARGCEPWFRGSIGAFRGLPRHLGHESADVEAQISAERGVYDIVLPEERTLASRVRGAAARLLLGVEQDGTPVEGRFGEPTDDPLETQLHAASAKYRFTPRQVEVVRLLARGNSNKEIAGELGCAETTVEFHVTQLLRKTGAGSRTQLVSMIWTS